jgi:hypothetical protein
MHLQHAFCTFKTRGFPKVGLAIESENETAYKLYENACMLKVVNLNEYSKNIS